MTETLKVNKMNIYGIPDCLNEFPKVWIIECMVINWEKPVGNFFFIYVSLILFHFLELLQFPVFSYASVKLSVTERIFNRHHES